MGARSAGSASGRIRTAAPGYGSEEPVRSGDDHGDDGGQCHDRQDQMPQGAVPPDSFPRPTNLATVQDRA